MPALAEGLSGPERNGPEKATHIIKARKPEGFLNLRAITETSDQSIISGVLTDAAHVPGGNSPKLFRVTGDAGEAELSHIVGKTKQENLGIVVRGGGTSITGAVVPKGEAVIDMSNRKKILERGKNAKGDKTITVQPGLLIKDLQARLNTEGLFLPSAPTEENAAVGGTISTNAAGARSEKYGKMNEYVDGLTMILANGEVLEINRGDYIAHPPDEDHPDNYYYELVSADGKETRTIPVPNYTMPDVTKISAGYRSTPVSSNGEQLPGMDLIDLVVGSEGTLGVIERIRLKVIPEPPTAIALIPCKNDHQVFEVMRRLSTYEEDARHGSREPGGISAIEYIGEEAVSILREHGPNNPVRGNAFVIAQVEMPEGDPSAFIDVLEVVQELGIAEKQIGYAAYDDPELKARIINMREDVPRTVNELVGRIGSTKVGADPCVDVNLVEEAVGIYLQKAAEAGVKVIHWGHKNNPHPNIISTDVEVAKQVVIAGGTEVIQRLGGIASAEHGVGKNPAKQKLLEIKYGKEGIAQMRAVKLAFDPDGRMAPGNIFTLAA